MPTSAALLNGSRPAALRKALTRHQAPLILATAEQLGMLHSAIDSPGGGALLTELRKTLRAVVLDEADAILVPRGKGGMLNRSRRDRALAKLPAALALARLIERRQDAEHRRIQLVIASATLSRRVLRDLATVVGKHPGKMGLATPAMALDEARRHERAASSGPWHDDDDTDWEARLAALEAIEGAEPRLADIDDSFEAYSVAREEATADACEETTRAGYGVRGGIVPVGVPPSIRHEVIVCVERRKTAIIASLVGGLTGPALLVVRDELRMVDVMDELRAEGIEGAIELLALGTAAERHHANTAEEGTAEGHDSSLVPEWVLQEAPPWAATTASDGVEAMASQQRVHTVGTEGDSIKDDAEEAHEAAVRAAGYRALRPGAERWRLIVAHESAIRGLDLPQLQLVVLSMMPASAESYIHISGRTGRAGGAGRAVSIFTQRELDEAGIISRAMHGVPWKIRHDSASGGDVAHSP